MVTDDEVEKAVDYLRDTAQKTAKARAELEYVEAFKSVVKSKIMKEHPGEPANAQEREAYSDPRYEQHLKAIKEATEAFDYLKFMRDAAQAKIAYWQTYSANNRGKL